VAIERAEGAAHAASDVAISRFVAQHYDRLVALARVICRDASDAADAVQIGLEIGWRKRSTLRDENGLKAWLDRIVAREAVRVSRSRRSWLNRLLSPSPEVRWIERHDRHASDPPAFAALRQAFNSLSPEQRAVVALHMHFGYTVSETADIVGAPEETVRSRLRLARERLRRELRETEQ
jgi:RNA polymerase sigma-70 factor (ECF subfamily)